MGSDKSKSEMTADELLQDPEIAEMVEEIEWIAWFLRAWKKGEPDG